MILLLILALFFTLSLSYLSLSSHKQSLKASIACINHNFIDKQNVDEINVNELNINKLNTDEQNVEYKSPLSQKWYREKQKYISPNLKKIYNSNWSKYGIDLQYGKKVTISSLTPSTSTCIPYAILDVGFGTGESIVGMSSQSKDTLFIGCEIYRAGIASAMKQIIETGIQEHKIKFVRYDVTFFMDYIEDNSFNEILIFFPDPWANERDIGKRVVRKSLVDIFASKMRDKGLLRIATDVEHYAQYINTTMNDNINFNLVQYVKHTAGLIFNTTESSIYRPITKYERIALDENRSIHEFEYRLVK